MTQMEDWVQNWIENWFFTTEQQQQKVFGKISDRKTDFVHKFLP